MRKICLNNFKRAPFLMAALCCLFQAGVSQEPCPEGWSLFEDHCFHLEGKRVPWAEAEKWCMDTGGDAHLASIHNIEENNFVTSLCTQDQNNRTVWTGLKRTGNEAQYEWSDKTNREFEHWAPDSPDVQDVDGCAILKTHTGGFWLHLSCTETSHFVCKKPRPDKPTPGPPSPSTPAPASNNCPEGSQGYQGFCYTLDIERTNWAESRSKCQAAGGFDLASVHGDREAAFMFTLLADLPEDNKVEYWLGGMAREWTSTWTWSDGTQFDFTFWGKGEPNYGDGKDMCAVMLTRSAGQNSGKWNDASCDLPHGSVCKVKSEAKFPAPKEPPKCVDGQEKHKDFVQFREACYLWAAPKSWQDAEADCQAKGAHLVYIRDHVEQSYIHSRSDPVQVWTGLKTVAESSTDFAWSSEGEPLGYTNWAAKTSDPQSGKECVQLAAGGDGTWSTEDCSKALPYVCKSGPPPPKEYFCPDRWWKREDRCYYDSGFKNLPFYQARTYCQALGGDLVVINDQAENDFILQQLNYAYTFWMGLERRSTANPESEDHSTYAWVDGTPLEFNMFKDGRPNSQNGRNRCVLSNSKEDNLVWENVLCQNWGQFICEVPAREAPFSVPFPEDDPPTSVPCNQDPNEQNIWVKPDQASTYCYKIEYGLDWEQANKLCQDQNARLVKIASLGDTEALVQMFGHDFDSWVGARKDPFTSQLYWTDGTAASFTDWGPGEPNDSKDMESCVEISVGTGYWNDLSCYEHKGAICQRPVSGQWPPLPPPPTGEGGNCPAGFAKSSLNSCYQFFGHEEGATLLDFEAARKKCQELASKSGGDLASIGSGKVSAFLVAMMSELGNNKSIEFYLGGFEEYSVWVWVDETMFYYTNWADNEPNDGNYGASEDCLAMLVMNAGTYAGKWNDVSCVNTYGYVCEAAASKDYPASTPSWPSACDLDGDHKDFIKYRGSCYKHVAEPQTWQKAGEVCQSMRSNLASILDPMEQAFLYSQIGKESTWIGLSNTAHPEVYLWSDEWPVSTIYWNHEGVQGKTSCAAMNASVGLREDGKWDLMSCGTSLPFVCKYNPETPPEPHPLGVCRQGYEDIDTESEFCFRIGNPNFDAYFSHSFADASVECMNEGGTLASIHSKATNDLLQARLKDVGSPEFWIGLTTMTTDDFIWTDKSPFDFNNWEQDEPAPADSEEACVMMMGGRGTWFTTHCRSQRSFICQAKRIPHSVTPEGVAADKSGLSPGAVAGIVIFTLTAVMVASGAYFVYARRRSQSGLPEGLASLWSRASSTLGRQSANKSAPRAFENASYENPAD